MVIVSPRPTDPNGRFAGSISDNEDAFYVAKKSAGEGEEAGFPVVNEPCGYSA